MQRLYHPDGDRASARAAEKFNTFYSMSSMGNNTIEEVSNISSGPKLFQLYVHKDRSISDDLIDRSRRSGFDAMCLTVDTLVAGNREKDHRTGFTTPPKLTLQSLISFAMRPGWVFNYLTGKRFELSNVKKKLIKELIFQNQLLNILTNSMIQQWDGRMQNIVQKNGMDHLH